MTLYRLYVFEPPDERVRHRREFEAVDDTEAVRCADELYDEFAVGATLDRYVLYEGDRVVHERVERKD